jgi:hypothetical protein
MTAEADGFKRLIKGSMSMTFFGPSLRASWKRQWLYYAMFPNFNPCDSYLWGNLKDEVY